MLNKNIVAIILVGLMVFHKQLNLKLEYLVMIACLLTILSFLNRSEVLEGLDEAVNQADNQVIGQVQTKDTKGTVDIRTEPTDSATRRDNYTINRNVNAPSNIGFSGDADLGLGMRGRTLDGTGYGQTAFLVDESGNLWSTSNVGVDAPPSNRSGGGGGQVGSWPAS